MKRGAGIGRYRLVMLTDAARSKLQRMIRTMGSRAAAERLRSSHGTVETAACDYGGVTPECAARLEAALRGVSA
jgi:hypothetical protein